MDILSISREAIPVSSLYTIDISLRPHDHSSEGKEREQTNQDDTVSSNEQHLDVPLCNLLRRATSQLKRTCKTDSFESLTHPDALLARPSLLVNIDDGDRLLDVR
jgi:hypothetical protein